MVAERRYGKSAYRAHLQRAAEDKIRHKRWCSILEVIQTELPDIKVLVPRVFGDNRGWFMESWSNRDMKQAGLSFALLQDNHSFSAQKGTLRGLHFQRNPFSQAKLIRCVRYAILDVAVDIRQCSLYFGKWTAVELSAENKQQFMIPRVFAHGFLTLTDDVEILYKLDQYYSHEADRSTTRNDPAIGIDWGIAVPILSQKDAAVPLLTNAMRILCKEQNL